MIGKSEIQKGVCMHFSSDTEVLRQSDTSSQTEYQQEESLEEFLSFIRSRLNIIGTSAYLLEESLDKPDRNSRRYLQKINREIETIRNLINK